MRVPVAYDIFEERIYGSPGEKRHRVLWVHEYLYRDGTHPDLDMLLEKALEPGGIDRGARTIHIKPLYYAEEE